MEKEGEGESKRTEGGDLKQKRKNSTNEKNILRNKIKQSNRDRAVAWGCSGPAQQWKSGIAYGDQPEAPPPCNPPPVVVPPPAVVEEFRDCQGCLRQNWAGRVVTLSVDSWKMGSGGELLLVGWMVVVAGKRRWKRNEKMLATLALSERFHFKKIEKRPNQKIETGNHGSPYINSPEACSRACTGRTMNGITANAFSFCDRPQGESGILAFFSSLSLFSSGSKRTKQKKLSLSF